jgi:hypothetical protein
VIQRVYEVDRDVEEPERPDSNLSVNVRELWAAHARLGADIAALDRDTGTVW